jgi:hypothetical protein
MGSTFPVREGTMARKETRDDEGADRYWKIRTFLEVARFGAWIVWEAVRNRF